MSDANGKTRDTEGVTASGGEGDSLLMRIVRWVGAGAVACFTLKALFSGAFWTTVLGVILTVGCYYLIPLAWLLGDAFRRFVRPDFYLTSSTSDLFYQRVFWMVGPQLVATFSLCAISAVVLDKATEATRMSKEGNAVLRKMDKINKEQAVEMERLKKEESDKKAAAEAKVAKVKKEYATLLAGSDRYPKWTDEQTMALQKLHEEIELYKASGENTQQEVESREESETRRTKNLGAFKAKMESKYGRVLGQDKCFVIRNNCYLENIHLNKEGDSLSRDDKSLLFQIKSVHWFGSADKPYVEFRHVNLLGKVYEYKEDALLGFDLNAAKKVLDEFGGTFSDTATVMKHLRIDEVIRVVKGFGLEPVGYAVVKRGEADQPIPSEQMVREERERQTDERIENAVRRMNIDSGTKRKE